jgi:hypothetical protein
MKVCQMAELPLNIPFLFGATGHFSIALFLFFPCSWRWLQKLYEELLVGIRGFVLL